MRIRPCRRKEYDLNNPTVVLVELHSGQIIEVPVENHKNWDVTMNFICNDCANGVHDVCKPGWCECQHVIRKPQVPPAE